MLVQIMQKRYFYRFLAKSNGRSFPIIRKLVMDGSEISTDMQSRGYVSRKAT
jgi:hypothetical protein